MRGECGAGAGTLRPRHRAPQSERIASATFATSRRNSSCSSGLIARRIVPWIQENDAVHRGERISLIQFGSRVDVYLPKHAKIKVQLGDKVVGGETVIAQFD